MDCADGSYVSRDASNGCAFFDCPEGRLVVGVESGYVYVLFCVCILCTNVFYLVFVFVVLCVRVTMPKSVIFFESVVCFVFAPQSIACFGVTGFAPKRCLLTDRLRRRGRQRNGTRCLRRVRRRRVQLCGL
jgi:hypothetical protein